MGMWSCGENKHETQAPKLEVRRPRTGPVHTGSQLMSIHYTIQSKPHEEHNIHDTHTRDLWPTCRWLNIDQHWGYKPLRYKHQILLHLNLLDYASFSRPHCETCCRTASWILSDRLIPLTPKQTIFLFQNQNSLHAGSKISGNANGWDVMSD